MEILKRLIGIPLFFISLCLMIIPFFIIWLLLGIDKANKTMDFIIIPIFKLAN